MEARWRGLAKADFGDKNGAGEYQRDRVGKDQRNVIDQNPVNQPKGDAGHHHGEHGQRYVLGRAGTPALDRLRRVSGGGQQGRGHADPCRGE